MAVLYTAREVNEGIQKKWAADLDQLCRKGITPTLATVRIGENGEDISYEKGATSRLIDFGLKVRNVVLPLETNQQDVIASLQELNDDPTVHGILLFQPLPNHLDDAAVKSVIAPEKDVDCATTNNLGALMAGWDNYYPYCAPQAVIEMLDYYDINLDGKYVAIVGSGLVVGKPLAMMLVDRLATVSICNTSTRDIASITKRADIIISAAGAVGLITKDFVSEGQIVIDVGTTFLDGKLYGDVDLESVQPIVAAVTPTPGGISGITTTVLAKHVIMAAKKQQNEM